MPIHHTSLRVSLPPGRYLPCLACWLPFVNELTWPFHNAIIRIVCFLRYHYLLPLVCIGQYELITRPHQSIGTSLSLLFSFVSLPHPSGSISIAVRHCVWPLGLPVQWSFLCSGHCLSRDQWHFSIFIHRLPLAGNKQL